MKTYTINKNKRTNYVDYMLEKGKCYIYEEFGSRYLTTFVCDTDKNSCDKLEETETQIFITI